MILKFLYVIGLVFAFFLIFVLFDCVSFSNEKMPLLGAVGIIISAFIASFSVQESIKANKKIKEEEKENLRYKELFYNRQILVKIRETFYQVEKNIKGKITYESIGLNHLKLDTKDMIKKIDSKEFFSFLHKQKAYELMNIIARLSSICHLIEVYLDEENEKQTTDKVLSKVSNIEIKDAMTTFAKDYIIDDTKNKEKLYKNILVELESHEVLPLFPAINELIEYLDGKPIVSKTMEARIKYKGKEE